MVKYISTYISYSDLYGETVPFASLIDSLKSFKLIECLNFLSKLQILLSKNRYNQRFQLELVGRVFEKDVAELILGKLKKQLADNGPYAVIVFHEQQIFRLMTLVLLNCTNRVKRSMEDSTVRAEFTNCFLIMNDHLEPVEHVSDMEKLPIDEQKKLFMALSIRSLSFTRNDNLAHMLVRYYKMFFVIPQFIKKADEDDYVDIPSIFKEGTGLDLDQYFALGFSIYAHYLGLKPDNINEMPIHIDSSTYFKDSLITKNQARNILKDLCITPKVFRKDCEEELSSAQVKEYSFLTLKRKPLLKIDKYVYSMSNKYLGEKITGGVYHTVLNSIKTKKHRDKYLTYCGKLFEIYVKSILNRIFPEKPPLKRFYSDIFYGKDQKEAGDGIIVYADSMIIIEVKSSRLLASTQATGSLSEYEDKLDKVIIKGAKTIHRVIKDFKEGLISIDGLPREKIKRFHPLIITIQFFPQHEVLWELIEEKLKKENYLQDEDIARLQIMEVEVLEELEPIILSGKSFLEILRQKDSDLILRNYSFSNFIDSEPSFRNVDSSQYMKNRYEEISEEIRSIVFGKGRTDKVIDGDQSSIKRFIT